MYATFILGEFKKWFRDALMRFMILYPIVLGFIGRFMLPWIADASGFMLDPFSDFILVALTLLTPHIYGALVAFSILDDRDDNILTAIKVTPLSIHQFLSFRLITAWILSFVACAYVIWFSDIGNLSIKHIGSIAFLASLAAPVTGLLINVLSKNKIEGFAIMKGTGMILIFPIIALFFLDKKELFFSFAPGFWPAKCISILIHGKGILLLTYYQYYFIGLVYIILLNILVYKAFLHQVKS